MAAYLTIYDAVDAFDLYDTFNDILDAYEADFYARSEVETDLRDLIEEHGETYEFAPDDDGDYADSMERNLKEALGLIFEENGIDFLDDEFADDAMDDDDIAGIYDDGLEDGPIHDNDDDDSEFDEEERFF